MCLRTRCLSVTVSEAVCRYRGPGITSLLAGSGLHPSLQCNDPSSRHPRLLTVYCSQLPSPTAPTPLPPPTPTSPAFSLLLLPWLPDPASHPHRYPATAIGVTNPVPFAAPCSGHKPRIPLLLAMLRDPMLSHVSSLQAVGIRAAQIGREFGALLTSLYPLEGVGGGRWSSSSTTLGLNPAPPTV